LKYNITFSCGHTGTVELFGKDKERHKKLEYFQENGLCSECYKKMMREEEQAQPLTTPTGKPVGFLLPSLACNRTSFTDFGIQV